MGAARSPLTAGSTAGPRRRALLIASATYADPTLAALRAPTGDVEALARVLEDGSIGGFDVRRLVDRPTEDVKKELEGFFVAARRDDLLLLYFSCHGVLSESGRLYFATATTALRSLRATAIADSFVNDFMQQSQARSIVLILDCRYSGAFGTGLTPKRAPMVDVEHRFEGRGRVTLSASTGLEYAFEAADPATGMTELEPAAPGQPFTRCLVQGLATGEADMDGDGMISVDDLYEYVRERMRDDALRQTPGMAGDVRGDIVIALSRRLIGLPNELRHAVDSPGAGVREGAARELAELLQATDPRIAAAARAALERLAGDDSPRVSGRARRALEPQPLAPRRSDAGENRHGLRARLRAAALAGVVPEGTARTARERTWWPPPAPAREAPSQPDPADYPYAPARARLSPWWLLLASAAAGGVGYLILERLLGSALPPSEPAAAGDDVDCTVFAPSSVAPGESILVQAFVHLPEQADDARAIAAEMDVEATRRAYRSLEFPVSEGTRLDFELRMPGLDVDDPLASMIWRGSTEAVQFGVRIPAGAPATVIGTLDISRGLAPLGHVKFKLTIDPVRTESRPEPQGERARRYSAAFISYASGDRDKVLELVRMLPLVGVRYFQDLLSLEPGDRWIRRLELGIEECDLFLLFWSSEAKRSEWVRHEVRYALARRGGDDLAPPEIKPVILEGPPVIEPWEELAHLHFDDRFRYFARGGDSGPAA